MLTTKRVTTWMRAMGEKLKVPDRQGLFIPMAVVGVLVLLMTTMGGVLFRAGQIVQNQQRQDAEWMALRKDLKDDLATVRELKGAVDQQAERLGRVEETTSAFMQASTRAQAETAAKLDSTSDAINERIRLQQQEVRLLKDYTEGRISGLPYRPPDVSSAGGSGG